MYVEYLFLNGSIYLVENLVFTRNVSIFQLHNIVTKFTVQEIFLVKLYFYHLLL